MFESVKVVGFQALLGLNVRFDPKVTVFVGPSDVGKSSAVRALVWLATNRPGGDAFLRRGAKRVWVRLKVDGHTVVREKGPGGNLYILDSRTFKAFGAGVPEPIAQLLNLGPVNVQGQHDPPWWFGLSPGEVSRELNAIVNLGLIDQSLGFLASQLRRATTETEVVYDRLKEAKAKRKELAWTVQAAHDLDKLDTVQTLWAANRRKQCALASCVEKAVRCQELQRTASAALKSGSAALSLGEELEHLRERSSGLRKLVSQITQLNEALCQQREALSTAEAELRSAGSGNCPACGRPLSP